MTLQWHEECLRNATASYEREVDILKRQQERLERQRVDLAIYEYQVKLAKERNMDAFDRERFNRKRSTPSTTRA